MKILFYTAHKHLPEIMGGMEINTHQLCNLLIKQGNEVAVAAGFLGGVNYLGIKAKLTKLIKNKTLFTDEVLGYQCYRAFDIENYVVEICNDFHPDVVIIQGGSKYHVITNTLMDLNLPIVSYLHTPDPLPLKNKEKQYPKITYLANSKFTQNSHQDKQFSLILPPVITPEDYRVTSNLQYVTLINPSIHKGVETTLQLATRRPSIPFLFVVNNSNGLNQLKALIPGSKIPNNVKVIGPLTDMKIVYKQTKLILAPSKWSETWGRIATEAHCSGIPVLATNMGGLPESVGNGGICLPSDAPIEDWLDAFDTLLSDSHYAKYAEQALIYSQRDFIQPREMIKKLTLHLTTVVEQ